MTFTRLRARSHPTNDPTAGHGITLSMGIPVPVTDDSDAKWDTGVDEDEQVNDVDEDTAIDGTVENDGTYRVRHLGERR